MRKGSFLQEITAENEAAIATTSPPRALCLSLKPLNGRAHPACQTVGSSTEDLVLLGLQ